jgi:5-formyltetrahydrofolate cyclo-ligase
LATLEWLDAGDDDGQDGVIPGRRRKKLDQVDLALASGGALGPMASMNDPNVAARRALRERLLAERLAMSDEAQARANAAIEAALVGRFAPGAVALVGGYWPIRREVDPLPYLKRVLAAGAAVALPAIVGPRQPLEYRPWTPAVRMEAGRHQIPHPAEGSAVFPTALLVPLVGFDRAGHRLGYGGGYYDRTLAALTPRPLAIGLGFELGRLATLSPRPHDAPMDYIFTEAGLVFGPEGG